MIKKAMKEGYWLVWPMKWGATRTC